MTEHPTPDAWEPGFLVLSRVSDEKPRSPNGMWYYQDAVKDHVPDFTKYRILCHNHHAALSDKRKPYSVLTQSARSRREITDIVIASYGGKCACCGIGVRTFLELDHVKGGGKKHRQSSGSANVHYRDALRRGFPSDYQVLCANCNWSKHFNGGACLHKRNEHDGR